MASEDQERASWDSAKDAFLVDAMTQQAQAGKRADSGLKKEAWTEALAAFNTRFQMKMSRQQIKSRLTALKGIYTSSKAMLDASGFGWDDKRYVVLVHDSVWDDYVKSHPKVVDYRRKAMPLFDDLRGLFEGTYATGEYALASEEPCPGDFVTCPSSQQLTQAPTYSGPVAIDEATSSDSAIQPEPAPEPIIAAIRKTVSSTGAKKRRNESGGVLIAEAISEVATELRHRTTKMRALSPSQRAIKLLQKDYANDLQTENIARAFDVMLDEKKAKGFLVMEAGMHG
ncbi:Myb/SANT-like DNA-binding domain [Phytophthora infestans]|uniref:Myb/SANT-like DNA-binding domain n=1 Tax=Phytophthora infestans TaxID=4787 RepID=A0A833W4P3_PHYIN|nr:Myb/SANT-like DNA-binding domain [Phytophthora infestans]